MLETTWGILHEFYRWDRVKVKIVKNDDTMKVVPEKR